MRSLHAVYWEFFLSIDQIEHRRRNELFYTDPFCVTHEVDYLPFPNII